MHVLSLTQAQTVCTKHVPCAAAEGTRLLYSKRALVDSVTRSDANAACAKIQVELVFTESTDVEAVHIYLLCNS